MTLTFNPISGEFDFYDVLGIGETVPGGTVNHVLYIDSSGNFAGNSGFTYTEGTDTIALTGVDPEIRMIDSGNNEYTRITKADLDNNAVRYNRVTTPGEVITGLIGHWKMNDNAANTTVVDSSSGSNDGTFIDATGDPNTDAHTVAGKINTALTFDAVDDYVEVSVFDSSSMTSGSISVWFKSNSLINTDRLISIGDTSDRVEVYCNLNKVYLFQVKSAVPLTAIASDVGLDDDEWHHLIATWDASSAVLYIDGDVANTASGDKTLPMPSNGKVRIGRYISVGTQYFDGEIDDVRLYNKVLSAPEIAAIYNSGSGTESNSTSETVAESTVWSSKDGTGSNEQGIQTYGDGSGRTIIDGKTIKFDIGGSEVATIDENGLVGINNTTPTAMIDLKTSSASIVGQIIRGTTGQTANLQEWQSSTGTVLSSIEADGSFNAGAKVSTETVSLTNPVFLPSSTDDDTGIGGDGSDSMSLIAGGANILQVYNDGTSNTVTVKGGDGQTANLQEWQSSSDNVLAGIDKAGALLLREITTPTATTNYGKVYPKADNNLYFQDGAGTEKTLHDSEDTVDIPINISMFDAVPSRGTKSNWNGGILELDNAAAVSSAAPFVMSAKGSGKILIVANAGSDLVGDITLTGTSVDRNTGTQVASATSVITLTGVTTDNSTTDANSNVVNIFNKAYITDKWFTGVVTITTTDANISDMDIYHCSFEQVNDLPNLVMNTFDANIFTTNVAAEFDAYLYCLEVTGDECNITNCGELHVGAVGGAKAQTALTNKYFRLRQGNIARAFDGTTDGFWVDVHYSNSPVYVEDVTIKLWITKTQSMTIV